MGVQIPPQMGPAVLKALVQLVWVLRLSPAQLLLPNSGIPDLSEQIREVKLVKHEKLIPSRVHAKS